MFLSFHQSAFCARCEQKLLEMDVLLRRLAKLWSKHALDERVLFFGLSNDMPFGLKAFERQVGLNLASAF